MDGENNGKPMKTLLKWDDLGVPLFLETSIYTHITNVVLQICD